MDNHDLLIFNTAPVAMWLDDLSELHALFERWRKQGITDLQTWLNEDKSHLFACVQAIKILDVNKKTLQLFNVKNTADSP